MTDDMVERLGAEAIRRSVWTVASVETQPHIRLANWQIIAVGDGRHLCGWNMTDREGRVSTAIVTYDPIRRRGRTASGRVYELVGEPGRDPDGEWVLGQWLRAQGLDAADAVPVDLEDVLRTTGRS